MTAQPRAPQAAPTRRRAAPITLMVNPSTVAPTPPNLYSRFAVPTGQPAAQPAAPAYLPSIHPGPQTRRNFRPSELAAQANALAPDIATPVASPRLSSAPIGQRAIQRAQEDIELLDVERDADQLTLSTYPTIYGPCGLFDLCTDRDLASLSYAGAEPLLDWLGWEGTDIFKRTRVFIDYVRPAYADGAATVGYVADPCTVGKGAEWGICDYNLEDFSRLRRIGPTRDVTTIAMRLCEQQPRYRLDGTVISNDFEFDTFIAMEALMQDVRRMIISGNAATAGQFSGLFTSIKTGYTDSQGRRCKLMDSIIINWNANGFGGGAGTTWNGAAITANTPLVTVIIAAIRRIRLRMRWSASLSQQRLQAGDIIIALPDVLAQCLLDSYTCWSVCPGVAFNEANLNTFEARAFRDNLMGGMFGFGRIYVDGFEIPLLVYDWELLDSQTRGDILILTRKVGSRRVLGGEYLTMDGIPGQPYGAPFWVTDGGRLLHWMDFDQTCSRHSIEFRPRIYNDAPWAQIRIQDVTCSVPGGTISPDPTNALYPETHFHALVCN